MACFRRDQVSRIIKLVGCESFFTAINLHHVHVWSFLSLPLLSSLANPRPNPLHESVMHERSVCCLKCVLISHVSSVIDVNISHIYFVVLDVTRSTSGAMSILDCDPCLPGRFSVLDVLVHGEFVKVELQNMLRLRRSHICLLTTKIPVCVYMQTASLFSMCFAKHL